MDSPLIIKSYFPSLRRTVIVSPPIPQLSVSTSSITTTVVLGFLPNTSTNYCVAPAISSAFFSGVTFSFVILIFTYGIYGIPYQHIILIIIHKNGNSHKLIYKQLKR